MKIVLASASPRRKELLKRIFDNFEIMVSDIEETVPSHIANKEASEYLAIEKAKALQWENSEDLIIAADTIVLLDDEILGKPKDKNDAVQMLKKLSGKSHSVITGCCLKMNNKIRSFSVESKVYFYPLTEKEILDYVNSGASNGKAGAYGIQDQGGLFVEKIVGDYYNIVGLPIARLHQEIKLFTE